MELTSDSSIDYVDFDLLKPTLDSSIEYVDFDGLNCNASADPSFLEDVGGSSMCSSVPDITFDMLESHQQSSPKAKKRLFSSVSTFNKFSGSTKKSRSSSGTLLNDSVTYQVSSSESLSLSEPLPIANQDSSFSFYGWDWMKVWELDGCSKACAQTRHKLNVTDILAYHRIYSEQPNSLKKQWLLDYFHMNTSSGSEPSYVICGKHVCFQVWLSTLGISQSYYYKVKSLFMSGVVKLNPELTRPLHFRTQEAVGWLSAFIDLMGDKMPSSLVVHLPSNLSKVQIYLKMKEDFASRNKGIILSQSHFFEVWKKRFPHVIIPKENRFTRCDTCSVLKRELERTSDREKREQLRKLLSDHNELQMEQRRRYHMIRERAETDRSIMSIILDGMDQNSTHLPHFKRINKSSANLWHMRTHITGVIVHGYGSYVYTDLLQWPHDPNLTMNVLVEVLLLRMCEIASTGCPLPKQLFLQMDNCARENKNQHVLAFLSLLVKEQVFEEIELAFLMVGHTHEDVDALFGNFSQWLKRNDACTLPDMLNGCMKASSTMKGTFLLPKMYDVKGWLDPVLNQLHNHSHPHLFKFVRDSNGNALMLYKHWSDDVWQPQESPGILLLQDTPSAIPNLVAPNNKKLDLGQLRRHILKYKLGLIDDSAEQWWSSFIDHLEGMNNISSSDGQIVTWPLLELINAVKESADTAVQTPQCLSEEVFRLRASETDSIPELYTGNYRGKKTSKSSTAKTSAKAASSTLINPSGSAKSNSTQDKSDKLSRKSTTRTSTTATRSTSHSTSSTTTSSNADLLNSTKSFVAFTHPTWIDRPLIGRVLDCGENFTTIEWWLGRYIGRWKVSLSKKNGELQPDTESIPNSSIVHRFIWNTNILSKEQVAEIKAAYNC